MFPARAGMSRDRKLYSCPPGDVPRASGDEPLEEAKAAGEEVCSPRERG